MKTDVLIAGAGPVGLTMASELTRFGLSVRIVDKNTQRTDKSKALVLWARTLELINRMSPNCADRFIEAGLKTGSVNILSGNETIGRADMTEIDSKYKFVLMIPQSERAACHPQRKSGAADGANRFQSDCRWRLLCAQARR